MLNNILNKKDKRENENIDDMRINEKIGGKNMKIAELLINNLEKGKKLGQMENYLLSSMKLQEGDESVINFKFTLDEYKRVNAQLIEDKNKLNKINNEVLLGNGQTISEGLVKRESLVRELQIYDKLINKATTSNPRLSRTEIKMVNAIELNVLAKKKNECAKAIREIDILIQSKNWQVDI